ncbi:2-oxoacid:acceptor oxidoreductase family protein [Caldilinea sp.]|jgi:2-oxoglutarate ferredoxin oxidoreductase subunit gamma|uniref:2-oxoacid:acceptor oxidoreductase family protein n=1 Tax=Caldilinea sp. TaxID=2293560 RepID=UPI001B2BC6D7|nr:2-oxoacid:acceptor oxidoreductase family protein [Caldilinea sp.]MBO9394052.1 2-oxoacid:acceptor oxidoreductase family protein [Caldilinea sp.]
METSIIISGFGGQGALFAGQVLAHAAMESGKEVTWIPSYGPEMRGGTAHCTVVIGDEPIGSPLVRNPHCVIAMNLPSVDKYEPLVVAGGYLLYDSTLVKRPLRRNDILSVAIPAHDIALRCGSQQLVNITMLGALLALCPLVELTAVEQALRTHLPERHADLLRPNILALYAGAAYIREQHIAMSQ